MCLTMIDGKVTQALTETNSPSNCTIYAKKTCQLSQPHKDAYEFGLSLYQNSFYGAYPLIGL